MTTRAGKGMTYPVSHPSSLIVIPVIDRQET
jgi:hypothetical protein